MLSCVKTEAVSTTVYTFLQKVKYHLLNLAIACIKVRHTHISLSNIKTTIAWMNPRCAYMPIRWICKHIRVPEFTYLWRNISHNFFNATDFPALDIAHMVSNYINNNSYTILFSFITHSLKFSLCSEPCVTVVADWHSNWLINLPPVAFVTTSTVRNTYIAIGNTFPIVVLWLCDRRSLNRCISRCSNILHILFDIAIRPVPAVKNNAFLRRWSKTVINNSCCLYFTLLKINRTQSWKSRSNHSRWECKRSSLFSKPAFFNYFH